MVPRGRVVALRHLAALIVAIGIVRALPGPGSCAPTWKPGLFSPVARVTVP